MSLLVNFVLEELDPLRAKSCFFWSRGALYEIL